MNIHAYMKLTSTFRYIHSLAISNQLLTLKLKSNYFYIGVMKVYLSLSVVYENGTLILLSPHTGS